MFIVSGIGALIAFILAGISGKVVGVKAPVTTSTVTVDAQQAALVATLLELSIKAATKTATAADMQTGSAIAARLNMPGVALAFAHDSALPADALWPGTAIPFREYVIAEMTKRKALIK